MTNEPRPELGTSELETPDLETCIGDTTVSTIEAAQRSPGSCATGAHDCRTDQADELLKSDTTVDAFIDGTVIAEQPAKGYRAGLDAVLLAAAVGGATTSLSRGATGLSSAGGMRILDAGSGAGVVGLCVAALFANAHITMIEREAELADLARSNAARNGWGGRVDVLQGDLLAPVTGLVERGLRLESFDHVVTNPPYYQQGSGTAAPNRLKAGSHAMAPDALNQWMRFVAAVAKPRGTITVIYRADGLDDLLSTMARRFGKLAILPIHPRAGIAANRIIVQGIKGNRAPLTLLPGLVLHDADNTVLPSVVDILRHRAPLPISIDEVKTGQGVG